MQTMIADVSSRLLMSAMSTNLAAFWSPYGRAHGNTLCESDEVTWFYSGIQFPLFNGVLAIQSNKNGVTKIVENIHSKISQHGAPALWWIEPRSRPDNIATLLQEHGLMSAGEVPAMAINLSQLASAQNEIDLFSIQLVRSPEQQALWANIAAMGTGMPDNAIEGMTKLEPTLNDIQYKSQQRYLGYLNGTPVATSALVMEAGVAGVYAVATLEQARKMGIGTHMTQAPLLDAKSMGYKVGILQASSAGYPIYKKMGFNDIYTYQLFLQS